MAGEDADDGAESASTRVRDSVAWGLVGGLAFLVLAQGYELAVGLPVGFLTKLGIAAVVTVVAAVAAYYAEGVFHGGGSR